MKRILSFFFAIVLIFALTIPCFAETAPTDFTGYKWSLNDVITNFYEGTYNLSWRATDGTYTYEGKAIKMYTRSTVYFVEFLEASNSATTSLQVSYTLSTGVRSEIGHWSFVKNIEILEHPKQTVIREWLIDNATFVPKVCTGETCPATDVNGDNICDDCGMPFTFNLRNDVYNYNGITLPQLPDFDREQYPYFFITRNETTGSSTLRVTSATLGYDASKNAMVFTSSGKSIIYDFVEPSWVVRVESNVTEGATAAQPYSLVHWTNFDLKDETGNTLISGDPNFMPPLWEKILKVTQGEMPSAAGAVHGTMTTLTLCGVGLIALLVGLSLFGKVFHRYRN